MPIDPWDFDDDAPLSGLAATRHAVGRARERRISDKEVLSAAKRAAPSSRPGRGTVRVTTGGGTTAVVGNGKVVTVFRAACPSAYSAPHKRGAMIKVPRCLLDQHGREKICSVEAKLRCRIQLPNIAVSDPVLVEIAVTGAVPEQVEREIEAVLGPWKVVDDAPSGIIIGTGGRMIKLLRTLAPRCEILTARREAMRGDEHDERTVLRGTPERMEAAHALIRKLNEYHGITACPTCRRTFTNLNKGRKHAAEAHATDDRTDEALRDVGFERLAQILSDPAAERDEVERRRSKRHSEGPSKVCSKCDANKAQDEFSTYNWDLPTHSVRRRECLACTDRRHLEEEEGDLGDFGP
jgi:hypothetical protein